MKKKQQKTLLWGLGALAALYFLTRPKSATPPGKPAAPKSPGSTAATYKNSTNSSVGYPYRNAVA